MRHIFKVRIWGHVRKEENEAGSGKGQDDLILGFTRREIQRRGQRAFACMTPVQREILHALRLQDPSYSQLADRHGITVAEVEAQLVATLLILDDVFGEKASWWQRLLPW